MLLDRSPHLGQFQKWIAPSWVVRAFRPALSTLPIPRCWNRSKHSTRSARPEQSRHQVIAVIPRGTTADYIRFAEIFTAATQGRTMPTAVEELPRTSTASSVVLDGHSLKICL